MYKHYLCSLFFLLFVSTSFAQVGKGAVAMNEHSLLIDGKEQFIYSGAFHYFRTPKALWKKRFQAIKDAGFNAVETYVPWNWHERQMPSSLSDYSFMNLSELEEWLSMAEQFELYVIVRPGPYICAEWDAGGFPQWLMKKKPAVTKEKVWLQSDDPTFLSWNKHWYDAVCKIVKPHQITFKKSGSKGVILFQIENEYNRIKWFSREVKRKYLQTLGNFALDGGINVPLFTCWTDEAININSGSLKNVVDFINYYPKWDIEKQFGGFIDKRLKLQPNKPLMSAELQGGWYSAIGGKLSSQQDGIAPVQTQNLTLYAIQRGFSLINYYMLCGGTNFDDFASSEVTTTYDFAAAISENGNTTERLARMKGIAAMIKEHGNRFIQSQVVETEVIADSLVKIVERKSTDGYRFFFVRTEYRKSPLKGQATIIEKNGERVVLDYALEPFGSSVYCLPPKSTIGTWYPKLDSNKWPVITEKLIDLTAIKYAKDVLPVQWKQLDTSYLLDDVNIYHRHFMYYKTTVAAGKIFAVGLLGNKVVNATLGDGVTVMNNGQILLPDSATKTAKWYTMPPTSGEVILLYENSGMHHHTNLSLEENWKKGIRYVLVDGKRQPLWYADEENAKGISFSNNQNNQIHWTEQKLKAQAATNSLLNWYKVDFKLSSALTNKQVYQVHIEAKGNGFIYLNGICIGRYWEKGPQRDFYLPECYLKSNDNNTIVLSLNTSGVVSTVNNISVTYFD